MFSTCRPLWGRRSRNRVPFEGEDNPSDLEERCLVTNRVAEDGAEFCGQAAFLDLAEGEALHEVL